MRIHPIVRSVFATVLLSFAAAGHGADFSALSQADAGAGLKEALSRGAEFAVSSLGQKDGFLGNDAVKIPLPDSLRSAEQALRMFGMGKQADKLVTTMNRAAEAAVVEAKPILLDSIKKMSLSDAKGVLTGGDDSATRYFRRTTSDDIRARFLPIVRQATAKVKLADQYNKFAGAAAGAGLIGKEDANLDDYVTTKAMDGLFLMVAEQERKIRKDPVGTGSSLLKAVFGGL